MPQSPDETIGASIRWIDKLSKKPQSFLDLGCGFGKLGLKLKNKYPDSIIDGLEVFPKYAVKAMNCETVLELPVYRQIFMEDVKNTTADLFSYDLVIALELLDKVEKDFAVSFIKKLSGRLIFSLPLMDYTDSALFGNPFEISITRWEHIEVMGLVKTCIFKSFRYALYQV